MYDSAFDFIVTKFGYYKFAFGEETDFLGIIFAFLRSAHRLRIP